MATIYRLNTSLVSVDLISSEDDSIIEGATIFATLKDKDRVAVPGAIDIPLVEDVAGTYEANLPGTLDIPECTYYLNVFGTDTDGEEINTIVTCTAKDRKS